MALFAIADLHLSLGTNKPMDIFGERWRNYVEKIEQGWRANVSETDTVIIAGDFSWAMNFEELIPDFDFLESLPGKKLLMKGNHDYWWSTVTKLNALKAQKGYDSIDFMFNTAHLCSGIAACGSRGWDIFASTGHDDKIVRRENGRLKTSCELASKLEGEPVVFMHYPPVSPASCKDEFIEVMQQYNVKRCYYGHIHYSGAGRVFQGEKFGINFKLISADMLNFVPEKISID